MRRIIPFHIMFTWPFLLAGQSVPQHFSMSSPDRKLALSVWENNEGRVFYAFKANGYLLIDRSELGPDTSDKAHWKAITKRQVRRYWNPVWGKRSNVEDAFNEAVIQKKGYRITVRAYNDGIAFRYDGATTLKERTTFRFPGNFTAWYYNGENRNIGPELLDDASGTRLPVMTIKAAAGQYMAIHEANLVSGQPMVLHTVKGSRVFTIQSQRADAWRVILYGSTPGKMVDSHLLELLNPDPEKDMDFSWVRPGVAVWDWRINGATAGGFQYTMSYASWVRMVDFAAAHQIKHLVLDADWYGPEFNKESDPLKGGRAEQVQALIRYAKQKGVGVWLYLNDVGGRQYPLEQTIRQYGNWGASGIKYGFMRGNMEEKNERTRLITRLCAAHKLMVDFHDGPVHPYGQLRTWPNAVTREYCHAQLDARRVFQPGTFVTAVFVNMLAGPLDMNNGVMDMEQKGRVDNPMPVPATITAEAARTLIVFSGATIIPDIPELYLKHPPLLKFISAQEMPWKESKTLSGAIGEYIVMARKSAKDQWLIAAATNEQARTLRIPLDCLEKGCYEALIITDGNNADFRTNKESYTTTTRQVTPNQTIDVTLAPGGGTCILLRKTIHCNTGH
ncbi:MAG: glycoside hydrolase family 97 catalytic domain-containing protein [Niabella sp.]|nr:glycoside hydrolase family 97 catalytic domain-containing protein [Niabella sp.]